MAALGQLLSHQVPRRSLLLGGVAAAGAALAGCTGSSSDGKTVTIEHWDWWVSQGPWVDNEIKLFEKAHPGIKVKKTTNQVDQYDQLFTLAMRSGDAPDFFQVTSKSVPVSQQIADGWIGPLPKADEAWRRRFPASAFVEGNNVFDGKVYSVPLTGSAPNFQLYLHGGVFSEAGLSESAGPRIPNSWDDVTRFAEAITQKGAGKVHGLGFGNSSPTLIFWWMDLFVRGSGAPAGIGNWLAGNMNGLDYRTGRYSFSTNRVYEDFIDLMLEWRDRGYFAPNPLSTTDEVARANFGRGKFGMTVGGVWNQPPWKEHGFTDYGLTTLVTQDGTINGYYYSTPGGIPFAINGKTKHANEAWAWFDWFFGKEAGRRFTQQYNIDLSVYPENNDPSGIEFKPFADFVAQAKFVKVGPSPAARNPEVGKVQAEPVQEDMGKVLTGIFSGQIKDIHGALSELDDRMQTALEEGVKKARAEGVEVSMDDFVFPD